MTRRRAVTLAEVVIVVALLSVLVGLVVWLASFGGAATARLTPQLSLQQGSRKAIAGLLTELQEGMEVVSPLPGCTLSYAIVRDKVSVARWYFLMKSSDGRTWELWRYADDDERTPAARSERLLAGIKRLSFTSRTEAGLQVNLLLGEGDQEYALLTTVRLRNIASAEEIY